MIRNNPLALAHVVEKDGVLTITQSNGPALRDLQNIARSLLGSTVPLALWYILSPESVNSWCRVMLTVSGGGMVIIFGILFVSAALFRAVNRFFGKETFIFDRNKGVFICNGSTVGPLYDILAATAQVSTRDGRNVMFRLLLELPYGEMVSIVRTHDIPAGGEFRLGRDGLGDPNTRFPAGSPWLNYEEQSMVPFLPQEITELRRKILEFIGEARPAPNA